MIENDDKKLSVVAGQEGGQSPLTSSDDEAEARCGERDGRRWALFKATAPQLSVLAVSEKDFTTAYDDLDDPAMEIDESLKFNVAGVYDLEDMRGYRRVFGSKGRKYSMPYLKGFVRAAAATWKECLEPINLI